MNTDHRGLARFPNIDNLEFDKLLKRLVRCINEIGPWSGNHFRMTPEEKFSRIKEFLGLPDDSDQHLTNVSALMAPGTCDWVASNGCYESLLEDMTLQPRLLWYHGLPGSGKSVLASCLVQHLRKSGRHCIASFILEGENPTPILWNLLFGSLALHLAQKSQQFQTHLLRLACTTERMDHFDKPISWIKLFSSEVLHSAEEFSEPFFWVVDGLDIFDDPHGFISVIWGSFLSRIPIRILLSSRWSGDMEEALHQPTESAWYQIVDLEESAEKQEAFKTFIKSKFGQSTETSARIIQGASGNFLWATLVAGHLASSSQEQYWSQAMGSATIQFNDLWRSVVVRESDKWTWEDRELLRNLLTWVVHSRIPLNTRQLEEALIIQTRRRIHLRNLNHLCGTWLLTYQDPVRLRHRTLREFLVASNDHGLCSNGAAAHEQLLSTCLDALLEIPTGDGDSVPFDSFTAYSSSSWYFHLSHINQEFQHECFALLEEFVTGRGIVAWIRLLAETEQLQIMPLAASAMLTLRYLPPIKFSLSFKNSLELWAIELVQLVSRFGRELRRRPSSIDDFVPAFCPDSSLLRAQARPQTRPSPIVIRPTPEESWPDILARLTAPRNAGCTACTANHITITSRSTDGDIFVFNTPEFSKVCALQHGEGIRISRFSTAGNLLATYGSSTIKIWDLHRHALLRTFDAPGPVTPLDMRFREDDYTFLVCADDGDIWEFSMKSPARAGTAFDSVSTRDSHYDVEPPLCAKFSHDTTMIAVSYENAPTSVWRISKRGLFKAQLEPGLKSDAESLPRVVNIGWADIPEHAILVRADGTTSIWDLEHGLIRRVTDISAFDVRGSPGKPVILLSDGEGKLVIQTITGRRLASGSVSDGLLTDMAICPDGSKTYLLLEGECVVWAPTVPYLVSPNINPSPTQRSENIVGRRYRRDIDFLAIGCLSRAYSTAHSGGEIRVYDANCKQQLSISSEFATSILRMEWSSDETHLAAVDVSGKVTVLCTETHVRVVAQFRVGVSGVVDQILINETNTLLLIISKTQVTVWSIADGRLLANRECHDHPEGLAHARQHWINHPHNPDHLVVLSTTCLEVILWDSLSKVSEWNLQLLETGTLSENKEPTHRPEVFDDKMSNYRVDMVHPSADRSQIFLQASHKKDPKQVIVFQVEFCDLVRETTNATALNVVQFSQTTCLHGARCLGLTQGVRQQSGRTFREPNFVYIDSQGSVCSLNRHGITHRFLLPSDYMSPHALSMARVSIDGTLFVPRQDEVTVIANGLILSRDEV